jgi:hypothetical protein
MSNKEVKLPEESKFEHKTKAIEQLNFQGAAPYKYSIWGADILSDIPLNLEDKNTRYQLIEAKMHVDKHQEITGTFVIKNGKVSSHAVMSDISYETDWI